MNQQQINAIAHEVNFWRSFTQTERFRFNWLSNRANPELEADVRKLIEEKLPCRVLDVGAGAVSILHGLVPVDLLTATDPLAEFYGDMVNYVPGAVSRVLPIKGEDLIQHLDLHSFDVVHMRNALDHAENPTMVMNNLFTMRKSGGVIIVHGFENEGMSEGYEGMHQWNIMAGKDALLIMDRSGLVVSRFEGTTQVKTLPNGKTWMTYVAS